MHYAVQFHNNGNMKKDTVQIFGKECRPNHTSGRCKARLHVWTEGTENTEITRIIWKENLELTTQERNQKILHTKLGSALHTLAIMSVRTETLEQVDCVGEALKNWTHETR